MSFCRSETGLNKPEGKKCLFIFLTNRIFFKYKLIDYTDVAKDDDKHQVENIFSNFF